MNQLSPETLELIEKKSWEYSQFDQAVSVYQDAAKEVLTDPLILSSIKGDGWVRVVDELPPFDTLIEVCAVITWRDKRTYVIDKLTRQTEQLEYGQTGFLLEQKSDYIFIQHPEPETFASEYATHWRLFIPPINQ